MEKFSQSQSLSKSQFVYGGFCKDLRLVKQLGEGNMGTVFLAVQRGTNKACAVKVMSKEQLQQKNACKMAANEKEILSCLDHPFLPSLLTHFESENHTFLAIEYCSGGDINVLRQRQPSKTFSEATIRFYAAEVVMALEYLHEQGIVYRDLKPENILVQDSGHIMLTDFDLSLRFISDESQDGEWQSRSFVGTVEYIAPEILWGKPHAFPIDWWSLGVFMYEMSHGKTPFRGSTRKDTFVNILCKEPSFTTSTSLDDLIQKLLAKDPAQRLDRNQVKNHPFFRGLRWDELEFVCRPPFVPPLLGESPFIIYPQHTEERDPEEKDPDHDRADMSINFDSYGYEENAMTEENTNKCVFQEF